MTFDTQLLSLDNTPCARIISMILFVLNRKESVTLAEQMCLRRLDRWITGLDHQRNSDAQERDWKLHVYRNRQKAMNRTAKAILKVWRGIALLD